MSAPDNLKKLYEVRFSDAERASKERVWRVLCKHYFQRFVRPSDTVLDIACGQGEFIRFIKAGRKIAVDVNGAVGAQLPADVNFICASADHMRGVADSSVDVCFASNFFEHLEGKSAMDAVLREAWRVLKPNGLFVNMQPNIRYAAARYWDFYDHLMPLSHLSAAEGFAKQGFSVETLIPRFVPFSTKSVLPQHPILVRAYLALPFVWKLMGGQFLLVARKAE